MVVEKVEREVLDPHARGVEKRPPVPDPQGRPITELDQRRQREDPRVRPTHGELENAPVSSGEAPLTPSPGRWIYRRLTVTGDQRWDTEKMGLTR